MARDGEEVRGDEQTEEEKHGNGTATKEKKSG